MSKQEDLYYAEKYPLHHAARKGDTKKIEELLASGHNIDTQTPDGYTALMVVASTNSQELEQGKLYQTVTLLLDKGANATLRNQAHDTAASLAKTLAMEYGKPFAKYQDQITELLTLTPEKYIALRKTQGANMDALEQKVAARKIHDTHMKFLGSVDRLEKIPEGIDLNYKRTGTNALSTATVVGNAAMVEQLLERGLRYDGPAHNLSEDFAKQPDTLKKMIESGLRWNGSFSFTNRVDLKDEEKQATVRTYIACYLDVHRPDGTDKDQELEKHISGVIKKGFSGNAFAQEHSDIIAKAIVKDSIGSKENTIDKILDVINRIISTVSSKAASQRELMETTKSMVANIKDKNKDKKQEVNQNVLSTPASPIIKRSNDSLRR
jgi:hypothetical protein